MRRYTYFPPHGGTVTTAPGDPLHLLSHSGTVSTRTAPVSRRAPGQIGVTTVDRTVGADGRTVTLQVLVKALSVAELDDQLESLAGALAGIPAVSGNGGDLGLLRVERSGRDPVETLADPVDSPRIAHRGGPNAWVDLEFHCPSPLWWETSDRTVLLDPEPLSHLWEAEGTLGWEAEGVVGWEAGARSAEASLTNGGDVPVPFVARLYGNQVTGRLRITAGGNISEFMLDSWDDYEIGPDGEVILTLEVRGNIPAGAYVEVDTGVNGRSVELVTSEGRETAIDMLNPSTTPLRALQIPRGPVLVRWEANEVHAGARAVVLWRQARAGV